MDSEYLLSVMQCMYHVHNCTDIRERKKSCVDLIVVNVVVVVFFKHTLFLVTGIMYSALICDISVFSFD